LQFLYEQSTEPWLFISQDDNVFSPGWLTGCFGVADGVSVVVPADGHNPRGTSLLTSRAYVDDPGAAIGYPGRLYHPDYVHNWHEVEMMATAEARGQLRRAEHILVEHAHPDWGLADDDLTYQRVRPYWGQDQALFESRRHLWERVKV
jgi:hypothetical protein